MFKNYFPYVTNYIPLSKDMQDYIRKITERYKIKDDMQKNLQLTNSISNPFIYIFWFFAGYHFKDLVKFIRRP
jgi:alanine-alpha-ketoisovalerate/valine-pyruvate aminotransferase